MTTSRYKFIKAVVVGCALSPNAHAGLHSGIREIYSGSSSRETCVVMADQRALCWGETPGASALDLIGSDIKSMALGEQFRCALPASGAIVCWGRGLNGEMGDGTTTSRDIPKPPQYMGHDFDNVTAISAGRAHICALRETAVWCWGFNGNREIGNFMLPASNNALNPMQVLVNDSATNPPLAGAKTISAGSYHTCILLNDNTGACWGAGNYGQLGNSKKYSEESSPQTVLVDSGGLQPLGMRGGVISAGGYASCGLVGDITINSVACWGYNHEGELATGDNMDRSTAYPATDERGKIVDAFDIALSGYTSCAIVADTTVRCWGYDGNSQLGIAAGGANQNRGVILLASRAGNAFTGAVKIVAGASHECVRTVADEVYCWGDNAFGQIGSDVGTETDTPTKVAIDTPIFYDNFQSD